LLHAVDSTEHLLEVAARKNWKSDRSQLLIARQDSEEKSPMPAKNEHSSCYSRLRRIAEGYFPRDCALGAASAMNMEDDQVHSPDAIYLTLAISLVETVLKMTQEYAKHGRQSADNMLDFDNEWKTLLNEGLHPLRRNRAVASVLDSVPRHLKNSVGDLVYFKVENVPHLLELLRVKNLCSSSRSGILTHRAGVSPSGSVGAPDTTTPFATLSPLAPRNLLLENIQHVDVKPQPVKKRPRRSTRPWVGGKENVGGSVCEPPLKRRKFVPTPAWGGA